MKFPAEDRLMHPPNILYYV